jgi:hypothetical protein
MGPTLHQNTYRSAHQAWKFCLLGEAVGVVLAERLLAAEAGPTVVEVALAEFNLFHTTSLGYLPSPLQSVLAVQVEPIPLPKQLSLQLLGLQDLIALSLYLILEQQLLEAAAVEQGQ